MTSAFEDNVHNDVQFIRFVLSLRNVVCSRHQDGGGGATSKQRAYDARKKDGRRNRSENGRARKGVVTEDDKNPRARQR